MCGIVASRPGVGVLSLYAQRSSRGQHADSVGMHQTEKKGQFGE